MEEYKELGIGMWLILGEFFNFANKNLTTQLNYFDKNHNNILTKLPGGENTPSTDNATINASDMSISNQICQFNVMYLEAGKYAFKIK